MKITRNQIRNILLEYEQHVYTDDDGVTWVVDDEGNRERKSAKFGQQWGGESGETYTGARMPWAGGGRSSRPRVFERPQWIIDQITAIEASIKLKPNKFLTSVLSQIKRSKGRGLSDKQNNIVKKILAKTNPESVSLFERKKLKINKNQLRKIIKEEIRYRQRKNLLNEGLMDVLGKLGGGAVESIKEAIAKKVMALMGIDTDSIIAEVFINFFGNLEIADIKDMLTGDNKCITSTGELAGAVTETLVEQIPELVGISSEGVFASALRETLSKAFTQQFNTQLAEALCEIDYKPIIEEIPGGEIITKFMD